MAYDNVQERRVAALVASGDRLFSCTHRVNMETYWQTLAEQFYPERADFTLTRTSGEPISSWLSTSVPIVARRELANTLSAMLRPQGVQWFYLGRDEQDDDESMAWKEFVSKRIRRLMNDSNAKFTKSTKETDNDFVTFGQGVLKIEPNIRDGAMLFRNRHLRDVVWCEDYTGKVNTVHDKIELTASDLYNMFGEKKIHDDVKKAVSKDPQQKVKCRQVVMPSDDYERLDIGEKVPTIKGYRAPFMSLYLDTDHNTILEKSPSHTLKYVIPRWQTVSGTQYAYSPATVPALPDALMMQDVVLSLIEAAQKHVSPPNLVAEEALRSDLQLFAGGTTTVSAEYIDHKRAAVEPIAQNTGGFPIGLEILDRVRGTIYESFFLNKLSLPEQKGDRTAYEVEQLVREYIRSAQPIFDPTEQEYNSPMCEMVAEEALRLGAFGDPSTFPQALSGQAMRFQFEGPLVQAEDRIKVGQFQQALTILQGAATFDQSTLENMDLNSSTREAILATGAPIQWIRPMKEVEARVQQKQQAAQEAQQMQQVDVGAGAAEKAARAAQALGIQVGGQDAAQ